MKKNYLHILLFSTVLSADALFASDSFDSANTQGAATLAGLAAAEAPATQAASFAPIDASTPFDLSFIDASLRSDVHQALEKIPTTVGRNVFLSVLEALIGTDRRVYYHSLIIEALAKVPADRLNDAFSKACKALCTGYMNASFTVAIIRGFEEVPSDRLNDAFIKTCKVLCSSYIFSLLNTKIILALAKVPADRFNDTFVKACKTFIIARMDIQEITWIINALAQVPADRFNDEFIQTCNTFCPYGMDGIYIKAIIKALAKVPADQLNDISGHIRASIFAAPWKILNLRYHWFTVLIIEVSVIVKDVLTKGLLSALLGLFMPIETFSGRDEMLNILDDIPPQNLEAFCEQVLHQIKGNTTPEEVISIARLLAFNPMELNL
ncbi:MAG: hypothetical protein Q8K36_02115 [Alphaproteobacteria bacterium]|nr:hypothetical protein [Alphaproteobacteria bacterium]